MLKRMFLSIFALVIGIFVIVFIALKQGAEIIYEMELEDPATFSMYHVNINEFDLRMFWKDENGEVLGGFDRLKDHVESQDDELIFATNGGMFQPDQSPVGLYIEDGKELLPLNTMDGEGNFYLQPNGIFYVSPLHVGVVTTETYHLLDTDVRYATQSGPMLVIDGEINSAFEKNSTNKFVRSGVCALSDTEAVFILSNEPVNFYIFAQEFRTLGCEDALYLDGFVSRMYAPEIGREDIGERFGVMIGAVKSL